MIKGQGQDRCFFAARATCFQNTTPAAWGATEEMQPLQRQQGMKHECCLSRPKRLAAHDFYPSYTVYRNQLNLKSRTKRFQSKVFSPKEAHAISCNGFLGGSEAVSTLVKRMTPVTQGKQGPGRACQEACLPPAHQLWRCAPGVTAKATDQRRAGGQTKEAGGGPQCVHPP